MTLHFGFSKSKTWQQFLTSNGVRSDFGVI